MFRRIGSWFGWTKRGEAAPAPLMTPKSKPLREFIYLDEVSLQSLLASQKGAITEQISSEASELLESEISGSMKGGVPGLTEAELGSRMQAQNANSTHISRKATVQSWFGELHAISDLRLVSPITKTSAQIRPCRTIEELKAVSSCSTRLAADKLTRGSLIEMQVVLTADPIFTMKTFIGEMAEMVEDAPTLFAGTEGLDAFEEAGPIRIMLQRLLVDLVPIRCRAVDHVVVPIDGSDHIVHRDAIGDLDIETRPLDIAGVTEESLYWRDLRRVLFSEGTFSVLARVGRTGLHETWNPVKLAQIFKDVVPNVLDQITGASLSALGTAAATGQGDVLAATQLEAALLDYGESYAEAAGIEASIAMTKVRALASSLRDRWKRVSDQTSAFDAVKRALLECDGAQLVTPQADLEMREASRIESGLSLFPDDKRGNTTPTVTAIDKTAAALMDVEIIAIYW